MPSNSQFAKFFLFKLVGVVIVTTMVAFGTWMIYLGAKGRIIVVSPPELVAAAVHPTDYAQLRFPEIEPAVSFLEKDMTTIRKDWPETVMLVIELQPFDKSTSIYSFNMRSADDRYLSGELCLVPKGQKSVLFSSATELKQYEIQFDIPSCRHGDQIFLVLRIASKRKIPNDIMFRFDVASQYIKSSLWDKR